MRIIFLLICTFFFSQLFCDESDKLITYHPYYCPTYKKNDEKQKIIQNSQIMPGYNASGRHDFLFFVSGCYLFFQPIEKGSIFAYSVNDIDTEKTRIYDINVNFKSGFRITLGCNTRLDDWTLLSNYMRYHINKTKNIHHEAICPWDSTPALTIMSHIKAEWQLDMDLLDLFLSRPFYSGTHVIIYPAFGLKGGWIHQKFNTNSISQIDQNLLFSKDILKSWIIGLCGSLKLKYIMIFGFSFFAEGSASLLYQDFKVRNTKNNYLNILEDNSYNSVSYINPNLNIATGFEWGDYFFDKCTHLSFLFGYESQVYWNQNLMAELQAYRRNNYMQEAGSLFLHGIIAKLKIDF